MRTKIVEVNVSTGYMDCGHTGHYTVIYDNEATTNPYRVYTYWSEFTDHGVTKHRKLVQRYGDFSSALLCIWQITTNQITVKEFTA